MNYGTLEEKTKFEHLMHELLMQDDSDSSSSNSLSQ